MTLKVLVVDDTILYRRILSEAVTATGMAEVVGTAPGGNAALSRIRELKPDLVTLDIEMPGMDGLAVLDAIKKENLGCGVLVISALTIRGGQLTMSALEKGAFDFITKPEGESLDECRSKMIESLKPLIRAWQSRLEIRSILGNSSKDILNAGKIEVSNTVKSVPETSLPARTSENRNQSRKNPRMVLIGVSTGGPVALVEVLTRLSGELGVPVFVVQHMPPLFTQPLAESLNSKCRLKVKEAETGEVACPGVVYIAPGGSQMRLKAGPENQILIEITADPPENNCRPSVDYLFRSVSLNFPGQAVSVIMTGMGNDGLLGTRLLKRGGCFSIAQDEASSVVYGMPRAIVENGLADAVLPLDTIAAKIMGAVRGIF
ncbi:MAG: protein-glutamate methylesterase/protein-glutamine glutaminase [Candidatus Rifleibacteriota bacterium]